MSRRRDRMSSLSASCAVGAALALLLGASSAHAEEAKAPSSDGGGAEGGFVPPPPGLPGGNPLDLAPIDLATLELGAGGIGGFEHLQGGSTELMAGFLAARLEFLGLSASAGTFRAAYRPTFGTGMLSGTLASVDEMMFGSRYPDLKVCPGFPTIRCDETSGYWGLGATLVSFTSDLADHRSAIRIIEGDFVGSFTPAFGKDWKRYRFLPRAGASLDWVSRSTTGDAAAIGRAMLGFDSSFAVGPVLVRPSFRWRPSTAAFVRDYTLEPRIEIYARETWAAVHDRDALRVGVELGFTHASEPDNAFGADLAARAQNTLFARVVVAPTIFTFGPP